MRSTDELHRSSYLGPALTRARQVCDQARFRCQINGPEVVPSPSRQCEQAAVESTCAVGGSRGRQASSAQAAPECFAPIGGACSRTTGSALLARLHTELLRQQRTVQILQHDDRSLESVELDTCVSRLKEGLGTAQGPRSSKVQNLNTDLEGPTRKAAWSDRRDSVDPISTDAGVFWHSLLSSVERTKATRHINNHGGNFTRPPLCSEVKRYACGKPGFDLNSAQLGDVTHCVELGTMKAAADRAEERDLPSPTLLEYLQPDEHNHSATQEETTFEICSAAHGSSSRHSTRNKHAGVVSSTHALGRESASRTLLSVIEEDLDRISRRLKLIGSHVGTAVNVHADVHGPMRCEVVGSLQVLKRGRGSAVGSGQAASLPARGSECRASVGIQEGLSTQKAASERKPPLHKSRPTPACMLSAACTKSRRGCGDSRRWQKEADDRQELPTAVSALSAAYTRHAHNNGGVDDSSVLSPEARDGNTVRTCEDESKASTSKPSNSLQCEGVTEPSLDSTNSQAHCPSEGLQGQLSTPADLHRTCPEVTPTVEVESQHSAACLTEDLSFTLSASGAASLPDRAGVGLLDETLCEEASAVEAEAAAHFGADQAEPVMIASCKSRMTCLPSTTDYREPGCAEGAPLTGADQLLPVHVSAESAHHVETPNGHGEKWEEPLTMLGRMSGAAGTDLALRAAVDQAAVRRSGSPLSRLSSLSSSSASKSSHQRQLEDRADDMGHQPMQCSHPTAAVCSANPTEAAASGVSRAAVKARAIGAANQSHAASPTSVEGSNAYAIEPLSLLETDELLGGPADVDLLSMGEMMTGVNGDGCIEAARDCDTSCRGSRDITASETQGPQASSFTGPAQMMGHRATMSTALPTSSWDASLAPNFPSTKVEASQVSLDRDLFARVSSPQEKHDVEHSADTPILQTTAGLMSRSTDAHGAKLEDHFDRRLPASGVLRSSSGPDPLTRRATFGSHESSDLAVDGLLLSLQGYSESGHATSESEASDTGTRELDVAGQQCDTHGSAESASSRNSRASGLMVPQVTHSAERIDGAEQFSAGGKAVHLVKEQNGPGPPCACYRTIHKPHRKISRLYSTVSSSDTDGLLRQPSFPEQHTARNPSFSKALEAAPLVELDATQMETRTSLSPLLAELSSGSKEARQLSIDTRAHDGPLVDGPGCERCKEEGLRSREANPEPRRGVNSHVSCIAHRCTSTLSHADAGATGQAQHSRDEVTFLREMFERIASPRSSSYMRKDTFDFLVQSCNVELSDEETQATAQELADSEGKIAWSAFVDWFANRWSGV